MSRLSLSLSSVRKSRTVLCRLAYLVGILIVGVSQGCRSDTFSSPSNPLAKQYWSVTLNYHAITMALTPPYNRLHLLATARTLTGAPLTAPATVVYTASDTSVQVDSTGLLTAIAKDQNVTVIVAMTIGGINGVTLNDTAEVNINATTPVPQFTALAIVPQPGDSARVNLDGVDENLNPPSLLIAAVDANGDTIPNTVSFVQSSNPNVVGLNYGNDLLVGNAYVSANSLGRAWLYAEATVYGVTHRDSLLYTVTPGKHSEVIIYPEIPIGHTTALGYFGAQDDTVAVGGSVVWKNKIPGQQADVVFDNPPGPILSPDSAFFYNFDGFVLPSEGGGNIPPFAPCDSGCQQGDPQDTTGYRARSFPTAGTYPYHSALYHTTGIIHVLP